MLLIVLYVGLVVVVGEIIYRYRYRRLKKDGNLSGYGAYIMADRDECYGIALMAIFLLLILTGIVWATIAKWSIPIE